MKIFLAGNGGYRDFVDDGFCLFYRLLSYHSFPKNEISNLNKYKDFILDSGIFTFLTSSSSKVNNIDWDNYCYNYANFVKKHSIKNYVELDLDNFIGLTEVEKLRKKLESIVGWQTMPVWHINRGYDKWLQICRDYNYVCFGAFLTDNLASSKYSKINFFLNDAKKNNCKVHGLGMTSVKWLKILKFYSVDSSTWSCGNRFGYAAKFDGEKMITIRPKNSRVKNLRGLEKNNFYEWVKFANYMENYY